MLFHTWVFAVFFLIVYPVFLLVRKNNRLMNIWLMIASYTFYGWWNPYYLLLLFGTSAIDYAMVLLMERSGPRGRKLWLIISLVSNFGFLGFFKYSGFLTANINALFAHFSLPLELPDPVAYPNAVMAWLGVPEDRLFTQVILPIGISFHTFQSMSYTIDAYRGVIETERSFIRFLTFVSFFPQLVAGPIERAQQPAAPASGNARRSPARTWPTACRSSWSASSRRWRWPIIWRSTSIGSTRPPASSGPRRCCWPRWPSPGRSTSISAATPTWLAGIARVMGFRMMLNFNNPYTADRPRRLLGALAHQPLDLVQGLPLLPARRQPRGASGSRIGT